MVNSIKWILKQENYMKKYSFTILEFTDPITDFTRCSVNKTKSNTLDKKVYFLDSSSLSNKTDIFDSYMNKLYLFRNSCPLMIHRT